jgi:hypothetical protein
VGKGLLSLKDRKYITGVTEKGGYSRDHSFKSSPPYMYPLYKIHKLNREQIEQKLVPPARMVTASVNGPTYRVGIFLDAILKPVAEQYCLGELVRDSTEFLKYIDTLNGSTPLPKTTKLVALDVDALYPNIQIELALEAITDALNVSSNFNDDQKEMIVQLASYSLRNSVVHYRGEWYKSKEGAPTGNPELPPIANIFVKYVVDNKILPHRDVVKLNYLDKRRRFLDDIWALWTGTGRLFTKFLTMFNEVGKGFGVTMKGECSESVVFLDVTTNITEGRLTTTMYVKPTDSCRYLNRRSFHAPHTFSGIPFSQFRRAAVICSDTNRREQCIERMVSKFRDSGYSEEELRIPAERARGLDRSTVLNRDVSEVNQNTNEAEEVMIMPINKDYGLKKELMKFFEDNKQELVRLIGDKRVIVAERKHANTASLLFNKSGFSQTELDLRESQKCGKSRCKNCAVMELTGVITCNGIDIKLDMRCCCTTDGIIYVAICKYCVDWNFYFGQTENSMQVRNRGHRYAFHLSNAEYEKSALSAHIYDCHVEKFNEKLNNFNFGIVKMVAPSRLDKAEDYFIWATEADSKGLNRYKVQA